MPSSRNMSAANGRYSGTAYRTAGSAAYRTAGTAGYRVSGTNMQRAAGAPGYRVSGNQAYQTSGTAALAYRQQAVPKPKKQIRRKPQPRHYQEADRTAVASMTLPITILLVAAVIAALFVGYRYLCLKSSIDTHMNTIKVLEVQLDTLRTENDSLEKSIDTSVDLNRVYNIAIGELGMVHVGQDNIIQYDKTESEYVKQYEDIPSGQ